MTLVNRISLLFFLLLALSLTASGLSIWSFQKSSDHVQQISLGYQVHGHIISLKSHTYQLFKQFGDAMTIGDLDQGKGEEELIASIRADIRAARATISQEFAFYGVEKVEELETLAEIELMIERLIADLTRISKDIPEKGVSENWSELWQILDQDIDRQFLEMISAVRITEEQEVTEILATVERQTAVYQKAAIGFAVLSVVLTIMSVIVLVRTVGQPVTAFLEGIQKYTGGNPDHRIQATGSGEIREIAETFNMMADQISERTASLTLENKALEDAVVARTTQLEQVVSDLRQAEENRRRMLADVSHELRTPLTIIQGEAEIALRGGEKSPEVYSEALSRARDAAKHTSRLVDDLLFIARNESGQVRLSIGRMDFSSVILDTVSTYGHGVSCALDLETAPMNGDAGRIRQALLVLLENARHHGAGEIFIRLTSTPHGYRASIEDDGPGMTDAEKARAFDRFYRGSNASANYVEGLGLGLPVAQSIAKAHGGSIELSDRPGGGLVAALLLPRRPTLKAVA